MRQRGFGATGVIIGLVLLAPGCGTDRKPAGPVAPSFPGVNLTVASVAAPQATPGVPEALHQAGRQRAEALLALLNTQRGEWEANRKAQVTVLPAPVSPDQPEAAGAAVLAFPADRMGELIDAGLLGAIPSSAVKPPAPAGPPPAEDPFAFSDILQVFRDQVARSGEELVALPIGGSALVLVHRRDAFERPENVAAAREAGLALEPPQTYEQLDALARFFHGRDWDGDGQPDRGIALALGDDAEGVADATFLARAAALGQHPDYFAFLFDDETMAPRIDAPPFVTALEELAALKSLGPPGLERFDAEAARAAFREGRAALLIDRAERAPTWTDPKRPVSSAVAPLPGSPRVFDPERGVWQPIDPPNRPSYLPRGGGWLVGLGPGAKGAARDAAVDFLRYLAGPEATGRILADRDFPVLPTRAAQLGAVLPDPRNAPGVDGRSWGRAVAETLTAPRLIPGLRIPEADGYLADLAAGRRAAMSEGAPAESALKAVADAWKSRTERLGTDRQLWHYRRSLNRPTSTPTPPPRPGETP
jgi:multiple sugar transport system substrate-binding protein